MAKNKTKELYARADRVVPWTDYNGAKLHEGDTIEHPNSGEVGVIVFLKEHSDPGDQWRVNYGTGYLSRLCLQIGDKGQASLRATGGEVSKTI